MVLKRGFLGDDGDEDGVPAQESKRFKNAVRDVMARLTFADFVSKMEPFLRAVVRDEVEQTVLRILQPSLRSAFKQTECSPRRGFLLHFVNKLPSRIFTGGRVEADDGSPIKIILLDANTRKIVASGSLSSLKIEILVLDGDFGSDEQEDWSENEFAANIIREREGRRPLVTGELTVTLKDGIGQLGEIVFTDNSSWQRSRKFRLGAKPVQRSSDEMRIREGRSEAFVVKDHRGELYKKHHPPCLSDEVWRLERIAKEGAFHRRLASSGIRTVQEFLQLLAIDPTRLRNFFGGGISNRIWDTIIEHANTCLPDDSKLYNYYDAGQRVGLLFNSIYKVIGATFDGQNYEPIDKLNPPQKVLVENVKRQAYKNVNNFILADPSAVFGSLRYLTSQQSEPIHGPNQGLQQLEFPVMREDQPEMTLDFNNSSSSTSYGYEGSSNKLEASVGQSSYPMQVFSPMLRNSFKFGEFVLPSNGENSWSPNGWPIMTSGQLTSEDMSEVQTSTWAPVNPTWGQGNALFFTSGNEGEFGFISSLPGLGVHMSRIRKPKAGWCKLRAALRMGSVRRDVAARKLWQAFCM